MKRKEEDKRVQAEILAKMRYERIERFGLAFVEEEERKKEEAKKKGKTPWE